MLENAPTLNPAEALQISPEGTEVANTYLQCSSIPETASILKLPTTTVAEILNRREVKSYIDSVFLDLGFNNRFRIRKVLDAVINRKLEEMQEADVGSNKDISELLALSHKMSMEYLTAQIKLEEAKNKSIKNQTNVQINDSSGGTNYQSLLDKLTTGK